MSKRQKPRTPKTKGNISSNHRKSVKSGIHVNEKGEFVVPKATQEKIAQSLQKQTAHPSETDSTGGLSHSDSSDLKSSDVSDSVDEPPFPEDLRYLPNTFLFESRNE